MRKIKSYYNPPRVRTVRLASQAMILSVSGKTQTITKKSSGEVESVDIDNDNSYNSESFVIY